MKIEVIGLGLIGGSMALDIREKREGVEVVGTDLSEENIHKAVQLGLIHRKATEEDRRTADMVIVSVPVDACLPVITEVLNAVHDDALVIDVGSTKQQICAALAQHPKRRNFLATHPIAGTEFSGPQAAVRKLFEGKTNIICEVERTAFKLQEKALSLFYQMGMRIRYMDPVSHDRHIAYVSHLSHISSFMLGKTVIEKEKNERDIFDMAGSGFESTVRLAKSSPRMWRPIFEQNRENVLETLEEYIANLEHFKSLLQEGNYEGIESEMENTNRIREILNGMSLKTT